MIYFHTYKSEAQLVIDIVADTRLLNGMSVRAKKAGMIILGGGVSKHQIANAMLFVSSCLPPDPTQKLMRRRGTEQTMQCISILAKRSASSFGGVGL